MYKPPIDEIDFVLQHLVPVDTLTKLQHFSHLDLESIRGVLEESGRFFADVVAPLNRVGDQQGSRLQTDGTVATPDGFKEAYSQYVTAGWPGAHLPEEWGGGGLPYSVGIALQEMVTSASLAFSLCPLLTQAAIEAVLSHGDDRQRAIYLEKLVTGAWTGTMNMTEPGAGSDVGALRTKAERQPDGTYRITGTKIFITWGDHDMAENVVHLVLARTPDAPPGTKGISMFLVPKFLVNPDGSLGSKNDVKVVSLEHKMGIHASPTCVIAFGDEGDGAVGHLVGEEQAGMAYMFTMMNAARVGVGVQGLSLSQLAYQQAAEHAAQRRQGRLPGAAATEQVVLDQHPDVRRMLLTMRAYNDAMRGLLYTNAYYLDLARYADDESEREHADEKAAFLTPISKAFCTDLGVELTSLAIQVFGGMGFVEETGAAQLYRDARIAPIYEGTNGIQAVDLVGRKVPMAGGAVVRGLIQEIEEAHRAIAGISALEQGTASLGQAIESWRTATEWLLAAGDPLDPLAGATPYLRMCGLVLGGWFAARSAQLASGQSDPWWVAKLATSKFYLEQLLPQAVALLPAVTAGANALSADNG